MDLKEGLYLIFFPQYIHDEDWENNYDDDGTCIRYSRGLGVALYIGDIPDQFFFTYYRNLKDKFEETYGTETPARMHLYPHDSDEPNERSPGTVATEQELMHMLRNYKKVSPGQREMMDIALDIKRDIMQFIVGSDKQIADLTDTPHAMTQVANGAGAQKSADKPADGDITVKPLIATLRRKRGKTIDLDAVVRGIFERYPETKMFDSTRLLLYLQDFARKQGIGIAVTAARIRQLPVWKENWVHRESGKTQNWENMGDAVDMNATDVNNVDYEND